MIKKIQFILATFNYKQKDEELLLGDLSLKNRPIFYEDLPSVEFEAFEGGVRKKRKLGKKHTDKLFYQNSLTHRSI